MKKEARALIKSIEEDRKKGFIISHHNTMLLQGIWSKLFSSADIDCWPYLYHNDMEQDIKLYYNL